MKPARRRLLQAALAALARPARAEGTGLIVTGDEGITSSQIQSDLAARLQRLGPVAGLRIAIGPAALHQLADSRWDGAVLSAYTSAQVWRSVVAALSPARAARWSAVYADPAPADQLALARRLLPAPASVACILGPDTAFLRPALLEAASSGVALQILALEADGELNAIIERSGRAQALLAVPDRRVFNPDSIRTVLLSTYRRNQAVIGFSADMVSVGALASTVSSVADTNTQLAQAVAAFAASGRLPPPQFPRYFRTVLNEDVARALGIRLDPALREFARRPA
ncbi:hypothetical protein [Massilia sp. TS11]|uniref:hypothetical protein n=1 Tax=Massilia sp. TS11 TaxID=2908003 RepID=UPI001EDAA7CA|nr:hypothetical protein [Massilia sp. TS11]MCG2584808.1 hypothetical protein [Massilia sp. TS11]